MNNPQLTVGSLTDILLGNTVTKPILQVLNIKKIQGNDSSGSAQDRYRLQLSDGKKYQPCMLATQMNDKVTSNQVTKFAIVMLNRFLCNTIHGRKIIIIIDMTLVKSGDSMGRPIGQPTLLELMRVDGNSTSSNQSPMTISNGRGNQGGGDGGRGPTPQQQNSYNRPGMTNGTAYPSAPPSNRPAYGGSSSTAPSPGMGIGGGSALSQHAIIPISGLSPYQSKWTIRARVASKPSIRTWSNSKGEGRVFNVDLVDESGEIRASAFHAVADKVHGIFQMGKVYYVSRGRIKVANKQFNTTNNNYELTLNEDSEVELCTDDSESKIPTIQYNFRPINEIESVEPNTLIDVIGVCKEVSEVSSVVTKSNRKLNKRELYLMDRSNHVVSCTLWGTEAEEFDGSNFPIVAVKAAKVSDFGGRSLSTMMSSTLAVNPDIPEAHGLRGWFDSVGKMESTQSISGQRGSGASMNTPFLILSQLKDLDLGTSDKPDYFSVKATVAYTRKESCLYTACPNQDCNKKVTDIGSGNYQCEKCNQTFPNFKYRMILSVNAADHSGTQWVTCFQDTGNEILGVDAQTLGEMRDRDEAAFDAVFNKVNFKMFNMKLRAKMDTFNDEQRLKCYCVNVAPVNFREETRKRIDDIKKLMAS